MTSLPSSQASDFAASWQTRLRDLKSRLMQNPQHPLAWRWRIQIKVLSFLVSRYGNDIGWKQEPVAPVTSAPFFRIRLTDYERQRLRSPDEIHEVLRRIAVINQQRES